MKAQCAARFQPPSSSGAPAYPSPTRPRHHSVSKPWCRMLSCDEVWDALLRRDFGATTDSEALAVARTRVSAAAAADATAAPISTQNEPRQQEGGRAQAMYRQLSALRVCDRCQLEFREGRNGPASCRFHPGVMFSGGARNGNGLSWTCCNRRSPGVAMLQRHADGCTQTRHVSGRASLWRPHLKARRRRRGRAGGCSGWQEACLSSCFFLAPL